jgi:hypothetical protein
LSLLAEQLKFPPMGMESPKTAILADDSCQRADARAGESQWLNIGRLPPIP